MRSIARPSILMLTFAACTGLPQSVRASPDQVVTFTFEEFDPATTNGRRSAFTSLTSTVGDVSIGITRENDDVFDILDSTATIRPASWGNRSLSPFANQQSPTALLFNLSSLAIAASIEFGDYGEDFDLVTFQAWSGPDASGDKLSERVVVWGARNLLNNAPLTASVSSDVGIASLRIIGGAPGFAHSVYYDNLSLTIPAPGIAGVFPIAAGLLVRRRRG